MLRALTHLLLSLLLLSTALARAQDAAPSVDTERIDAMERLEAQSASPSAPVFALGWRNHLTARVGAPLAIFREPRGWLVRVDPAVELFNVHGLHGFPFQQWRGLLSLHATFRDVPDPTLPLALGVRFGVAHESDHQSAPDLVIAPFCGWAYTNALFVDGRGEVDLGDVQLAGALRAAWHFYSSTRVPRGELVEGPDGRAEGTRCRVEETAPSFESAQNVELTLDLQLRTGGPHVTDDTVRFCAAAHVGWLPATPAMYEEARVVISAGGCYRAAIGDLQLVGELWLGSYVGLFRFDQFPSGAAMFRWSL